MDLVVVQEVILVQSLLRLVLQITQKVLLKNMVYQVVLLMIYGQLPTLLNILFHYGMDMMKYQVNIIM